MEKEFEFGVETFGQTFKRMRTMKGYSQSSVAKGICSPQFLRKFESGESDITIVKMNSLLNKIFLSWNEFILENKGDNIDTINKYHTQNINTLILNERYSEAEEYCQIALEYSNSRVGNESLFYKLLSFSIRNFISVNTSGKTLSYEDEYKTEFDDLRKRLFKTKYWTMCEYSQLLEYFFLFNVQEKEKLFLNAYESYSRYSYGYSGEQPDVNIVLLTAVLINNLIMTEKFETAKKIYNLLEEEINKTEVFTFMYERSLAKFQGGVIDIYLGKIDEGKKISDQYIKAFDLLGSYEILVNDMYAEQLKALEYAKNKHNKL